MLSRPQLLGNRSSIPHQTCVRFRRHVSHIPFPNHLISCKGYIQKGDLISKSFIYRFSPRVKFIGAAVVVVAILAGVTLTLTLVLRTQPPPNGGSPTLGPPLPGGGSTTPPTSTPPTFDSAARSFRYGAVQTDTEICSTIGT